jgi:phosphate transport system substrate-binding protein
VLPLTICRAAAVFLLLAGCANAGGAEDGTLQVSGSTTVNPVAADAAEALRGDGLRITVDTQGGSAGGLAQLGAGEIDIAMSSKPVGEEDRAQFPNTDFVARQIGADAVGVIVRREVYDGGVRSLTKDQARQLYEGRIANWSQLGGPDLPVFIYDK